MKKSKRTIALGMAALMVIALIVSAMLLFGGKKNAPAAQGNLLQNGDFSAVTDGMPDGWTAGMWVTSAGASYLEAAQAGGESAALVENVAPNDARFEQTVAVRENSTYKLTARVMAEGCDPAQLGANVSFLGVYGTSDDVHDTAGAWQTLTLYARTGEGMKDATVCVRLGGYGSEATGRAWFTDVSLEQVEDVPVGAFVLDLSTPAPQEEETPASADKGAVIPGLLAAAAAYLALALVLAKGLLAPRAADEKRPPARDDMLLGALLLGGLALRVLLAGSVRGYGVDMGCFSAWAGKMASGGAANFYEPNYFCDYPPGYLLVLGLLGKLAQLTGVALGTPGGELLLKAVPVLCDMLLALACYRMVQREMGGRAALGAAALIVLSPAFVIAGACWGQIDSVLCVLLLALLLPARRGKWQIAIPVFALAVLAKPQAGLLAPLGVAALARDVIRHKETRKPAALGLLLGLGVTAAVVLPFSPNQDSAFWLVDKYMETLSSYAYATLSTGNLMFLLGGNWTPNETVLFAGVTYGALGTALMLASFAFGLIVYLRGRGRSRLLLSSAVTLQLVFVLGSKMHERYILPALALLLLAFVETGDMRLLLSGVLATAASAVNIGAVLAFEHLVAPNLWLGYLIGAVQLFAAGLTVWAAIRLSMGREPMRLKMRAARPDQEGETLQSGAADARLREALLSEQDYRLHMKRADWAVMLALTLIYGVIGFYQLGAAKAPQTAYASTAQGESVTLDLGERREDFHIYYYGGVSQTQFGVALSDDGESFTEETGAYYDIGECYKWLAMRRPAYGEDGRVESVSGGMLPFSGRYIRITFDGAAGSLWEIAAVDGQGRVLPVVSASAEGGAQGRMNDAGLLIDEQDTVPDVPSYLNSMYFDEIYHARTGYEHAHAQHTYETTHPPLGKVFMSWCIRLMGMTPFAWRFAGALCGVLMVPAMYLLAKTLLSSCLWAGLCTLLLSFDCMHFTQTRIATIDSFPVLFMMLMFLFMARWMKMSFYHQRLRDTFVPLALSGVCMGLAIASKWIGCYGAVGLAVLFFARFYQLCRQGLYACAHAHEDPALARAAALWRDRGVKTILACFVFFVFVPLAIYAASYIPYLSAYGEVKWNMTTLQRLWDAQVLMLDYHANLVAEHYFASPWYEWPVIAKPMWYYAADYKGAGMTSSILAFGNPAVWWTGLAGMVFVLVYSVRRNALPALGLMRYREDADDRAMPVICVAFLSGYLPWVLVSRLTFIYHYFASVPWIIIATALGLKYLQRRHKRLAYALAAVLSAAAVALFIAFYPLASGMEVPRAWCDAVSWFDGWMWY